MTSKPTPSRDPGVANAKCREGLVANGWRAIAPTTNRLSGDGRESRMWLLECVECGARIIRAAQTVERTQRGPQNMDWCTHPIVDEATSFADGADGVVDGLCNELIAMLGPMPLTVVGAAMHLSAERVRQVEEQAFAKLRRIAEEDSARGEDMRDWMLQLAERSRRTEPVEPEETGYIDHEDVRRKYKRMLAREGIPPDRWGGGVGRLLDTEAG
jgi:hypothetical protein